MILKFINKLYLTIDGWLSIVHLGGKYAVLNYMEKCFNVILKGKRLGKNWNCS